MSRLVSTVHVLDDESRRHEFGPGIDVPEWAAAKMGAHCFEDGEHPYPEAREAELEALAESRAAQASVSASVPAPVSAQPEPTIERLIELLGQGTAAQRNLLREALAGYEEQDTAPPAEFDPAEHNVDEVNEYLTESGDEQETERVLAAEAAGKSRAGILNGPHADQQPA